MKTHGFLLPGGAALFFLAAAALFALLPGCSLPAAAAMALVLTLCFFASLRALGGCLPGAIVCCAVVSAALLLGRIPCFPRETSDYTDFLLPWVERLRELGGLPGLGREIGNYNVPYMVILALISYLPLPPVYLIKLTTVLFDLLQAAVLSLLVGRLGGGRVRPAVCFPLALALPTVFINGAVWGQCDSVYVSLALLGLYLCLAEKPGWGMAAFGLSFAFKLQAVFLLPIVLPLLIARKVKLYHLPLFPAVYALAVSPAILAGRSVKDVFLFYLHTASTAGSALNYNSASMYSLYYFYRLKDTGPAAKAGILAAFALCLLVFLLFFLGRKRITERSLLFASLLLCCGLPLLLPHMHDRYFYFCDVLTLCAACLVPETAAAVLLSQFASLLGYHAYFYMRFLLPMRLGFAGLCAVFLAALVLLLRELFFGRRGGSGRPPERRQAG